MTPGYSPPEQYGTARTDTRTDIYSLGATLYAALTGIIPEDGLARAMDNAQLTPIRKRNSSVSRNLAAAIEKAMELARKHKHAIAEIRGLGLMLGDINATNAGIWERIVQDLLALSRTTVITVVTEREALRVDHWCRDVGRKSEVFENPRHPFLDRWVCLADPRR